MTNQTTSLCSHSPHARQYRLSAVRASLFVRASMPPSHRPKTPCIPPTYLAHQRTPLSPLPIRSDVKKASSSRTAMVSPINPSKNLQAGTFHSTQMGAKVVGVSSLIGASHFETYSQGGSRATSRALWQATCKARLGLPQRAQDAHHQVTRGAI